MPQSKSHPLRNTISDLTHERALPNMKSPLTIRHWVIVVSDDEKEKEREWIKKTIPAKALSADGTKAFLFEDGIGKIYERHGEFSTFILYETQFKDKKEISENFGFGKIKDSNFDWINGCPGKVFRSMEIGVINFEPAKDKIDTFIDTGSAVCCDLFDTRARFWSDFRMRENGAGRTLIYDKGLMNDELSRLLQSVVEVGQYRKLALLGFPVARAQMGWLKSAETSLSLITKDMNSQSASQDEILDRIMALSYEMERRTNEVGFRFSATAAYNKITMDRLQSLRESRVDGYSTMQEFIQRRFQPAMRTCEAATKRFEDLSIRIERVNNLLRSRISMTLERQNQELLKSMDLRAKLQSELSELVEGLSVFAIGYYIFSLVKYVLEAFLGDNPKLLHILYAPTIIIILLLAFWFIHNRKKRIMQR